MIAHQQAVVAFSGGMDSSLLALAAQRYIPDSYLAILVNSEFMSANEMRIARAIAQKHQLRLKEITVCALAEPLVAANPPLRCYHCKKAIFTNILALAQAGQTIYEGAVTDDNDDYRPGKQAIKELGVVSPLLECGFSKAMVGEALRHWGAGNLVRPAQSCLATRIETDTAIDKAILQQIEKAEELLRNNGLQYCRLRHHNNIARIEVAPDQIHRAIDIIACLSPQLKSLGYKHICIDIGGYQKGSMNRPTGHTA
ncbi:MAG: TIGR00268 family protein [Candidatus Riflebacteria bacterium HGW-Riflebacteria-1]|jgi:uncharacterized protein|nr:MAG: TIGR00268 family protein [Candidatus Riflebacteria bacterium HGW-Riflebacteria-1]